MNISFILDRLNLGGAERHTLNLARSLKKRGHDVSIIVLFNGGSDQFPIQDFPSPPVMLGEFRILSIDLVRKLRKILAELNPDIVFTVNQTALVAASVSMTSKTRSSSRIICIFHTTELNSFRSKIKIPVFKYFVRRADALVYVSKIQQGYWRSNGLYNKNVVAIQNGVNVEHFRPHDVKYKSEMRAKLGFQSQDLVVTLVGRLSPEKNHEWLCRSFASMIDMYPHEAEKIKILFVGEGELRSSIEKLVVSLGLSERVKFAGSTSDVRPFIAASDIGLIVSNSVETFSLAALEIMASGVPMIMTRVGGAEEIILNDIHGMLIDRDDEGGLIGSLINLSSVEARERMGQCSRSRVVELFDYEGMVDKYDEFIKKIALTQ